VVAFDVGGISEQISPSNGLLIKTRDTSSLAEGLSQFFDQQSAYEPQLIAQAAANEYAVDRVISQHMALYSSLAGNV
jgi:glycosyltransferase involved in cell wall biosynthesis